MLILKQNILSTIYKKVFQKEIFECYCLPLCPNNIQAHYICLTSSTLTRVPKILVQEIIPFPIQEST